MSDGLHQTEAEAILRFALQWPERVEPYMKYITPDAFQDCYEAQYVAAQIYSDYEKYGQIPTKKLLRARLAKKLTGEDPYKAIFAIVEGELDPRDVRIIERSLEDWLRRRIMEQLYSDESIAAHQRGEYDKLQQIFDDANSVGIEEELFTPVPHDTLFETTAEQWLIDDILTPGQPMVIGGAEKSYKTYLAVDMAISLATSTQFLGKPCEKARIIYFYGEGRESSLQPRIQSICEGKGLEGFPPENLQFILKSPVLTDQNHLSQIKKLICKNQADLLIVDPVYLSLLKGNTKSNAGNIFDMGSILSDIQEICTDTNTTLVLIHHFNRQDHGKWPTLRALSFTGLAEYARQWILIESHSQYRLNAVFGGQGYSHRKQLHITENSKSKIWKVHVIDGEELEKAERTAGRAKQAAELEELCDWLRTCSESVSKNKIREHFGWSGGKATGVLERAVEQGLLDSSMKGNRQTYSLRTPDESSGPSDGPVPGENGRPRPDGPDPGLKDRVPGPGPSGIFTPSEEAGDSEE